MMLSEKMKGILAAIGSPARIYLGIIFILASLFKIWEPYDFALSVATYQFAPLWTINLFSIIVPWIELLVGIAFVLGFWTRESAFIISAMMLLFLTVLIVALSKGLQMSCGCFAAQGVIDEIGMHTVFRDLAWLFIALYVMLFDDGRYGLDRFLKKGNS